VAPRLTARFLGRAVGRPCCVVFVRLPLAVRMPARRSPFKLTYVNIMHSLTYMEKTRRPAEATLDVRWSRGQGALANSGAHYREKGWLPGPLRNDMLTH
jgi:hypothetical protein